MPNHRKRNLIGAALIALVVAIPVIGVVQGRSAEAADALPGDGTTAATAGASCWGIKQQHGSSPTGTYWLNTAVLGRPQQFHCDMTTDGGGWVLVGRGRNGWSFNPLGQASAATVRTTVSGPGAFAPAALDTETIAALLNGTDVSKMPEGIRVERATNAAGTTTQDVRLHPKRSSWTWSFPLGQLLSKISIDGTTYTGSNTADTAASAYGQSANGLSGQSGLRRMFTTRWKNHDNQQGFSFGAGVSGGSNGASNHLWTAGSEGSPLPFTRVWIRPRIANDAAGFSPLPSAGLPAAPKPATLKSRAEVAPWGVVGNDHTGEATVEPWNTNVLAVKASGGRVFVGGRFTGVRNGPTGATTEQRSLAAFDLDGNWISTFRPKIDGRVFNLATTADGTLLVAGDFTSVDGQPNTSGIAALDPTTGKLVAGFRASVSRANGERPIVRGLDVRGSTAYIAGGFNRFTGGTWNPVTVSNAISFDATTGTPGSWRPRLSGGAVDVNATDDGARVLLAGYFSAVNNDANMAKFAITDAATGNPSAGIGTWIPAVGSGTKTYQQAVADVGDKVLVGGSEHNIQLWDRNRTNLLSASVTKQGGDTQAIDVFDGTAYIACHCGDGVYQGTNDYASPSGFRSVDAINLVGAFDPGTLDYDPLWYPSGLKGARGEGVWTIDRDERGCLWVGGDLERSGYSGVAANDWLGGFGRFCPADTTVPTPPSNLRSSTSGSGVKLTWSPSTDDGGTVSYDVYRNDRVIATVWGTSYDDPNVTGVNRYTVRASDARGNRSAAPAPINVGGPAPKIAAAVAFGSRWSYLATAAPDAAWRTPDFAAAGWPAGNATLGWGTPGLGTTLDVRPQTFYARTSFDVADPSSSRMVELKVKVATGAVVSLNGVEAGRINMPAGRIEPTTPASAYIWGAEEAKVHTLLVPATLLRKGTNAVAVEVHSMTPNASRAFVDVEVTTYGSGGDSTPPDAPGVTATAGSGTVSLSWSAGADDVALGGYLIARDGVPVAVTGPTATGWIDGSVDTAVPHTYVVTAFDANGNAKAAAPVSVGAQVDPNLLGFGSTWRWTYPEGGAPAGWMAPGFDDRTWATGAAELGYGDSDERTIISTAPAPRPLTAYFRTTVDVPDPAAFSAMLVELVRDDGAVVYVNGVEVGRDNLPAGPITPSTKASVGIQDRAAEKAPVAISIPSSAFVPGQNVIAVEVHNADRASGDLSFDLKLTGQR